jgi:hypothetical protein
VGFTGSSLHEDSHTPPAAELIALAKVNLHKIESQLRRTDGLRVKKQSSFHFALLFDLFVLVSPENLVYFSPTTRADGDFYRHKKACGQRSSAVMCLGLSI